MIYDCIETAYTVAVANFTTDLTALASAKGITVTTSCAFEKRQSVEFALHKNAAKPFCCVNGRRATTQGKDQSKRDSLNVVVFDYYAEHTDPVRLAKQTELAAEALLHCADRFPGAGNGVYGVGEEPLSWTIELTGGYEETSKDEDDAAGGKSNYFRRATVTIPIWDRDTGL